MCYQCPAIAAPKLRTCPQQAKSWHYLLNNREKKALHDAMTLYRNRFGGDPSADMNLVIFLGDDPRQRLCWSATGNKIPTLRMNQGKFFIPAKKRWFLDLV